MRTSVGKAIVGLGVAVLVCEVIAIGNRVSGDTITEMTREQARKRGPIVPFAVGVVMGHLFWTER